MCPNNAYSKDFNDEPTVVNYKESDSYLQSLRDLIENVFSMKRTDQNRFNRVSSIYNCLPVDIMSAISNVNNGDCSSPSTWERGNVSSAQDDVIIKAGSTVNIVGDCLAKTVTVNGVLKNRNNGDFILITERVMMGEMAEFIIGTPNTPYYRKCQNHTYRQ